MIIVFRCKVLSDRGVLCLPISNAKPGDLHANAQYAFNEILRKNSQLYKENFLMNFKMNSYQK